MYSIYKYKSLQMDLWWLTGQENQGKHRMQDAIPPQIQKKLDAYRHQISYTTPLLPNDMDHFATKSFGRSYIQPTEE